MEKKIISRFSSMRTEILIARGAEQSNNTVSKFKWKLPNKATAVDGSKKGDSVHLF